MPAVLMVAEKPSLAASIAHHLSHGQVGPQVLVRSESCCMACMQSMRALSGMFTGCASECFQEMYVVSIH